MIEAIITDSREPNWISNLTFNGIPHSVTFMDTGDAQAICNDGNMIIVERKTPEDFLNTLRDDRLFPQLARMVESRLDDQAAGIMTNWPYLCITGSLRNVGGKVATDDRGITGWDWHSVQGALLTIQEMGVFVIYCDGDADYEDCILRLGNRKRGEIKLLPPRPPVILGPGAAFLASLPGIGPERVMDLLQWSGNSPAHALVGIVDLSIKAPLPESTRKRIRNILGLADRQTLDLWIAESGDQCLKVLEEIKA